MYVISCVDMYIYVCLLGCWLPLLWIWRLINKVIVGESEMGFALLV